VAEIFGLPGDVVQRILALDEETRMQRAMYAGVEAVREMAATWRAALMPRLSELPRRQRRAGASRDHPAA
jgi:hypothetical protein